MIETLRHHFNDCTVPQCERLFFLNEDFNRQAALRAKSVCKIESLTVDKKNISLEQAHLGSPGVSLTAPRTIERVVEFTSHRPIKRTLRQYFDPPAVKFVETLLYRTGEHRGSIAIVPMLDICTVEGNIALQSSATGVDRTIQIDVKMRKRWFFIKWIAEKYIIKSVRSSYDEIHDFTQGWLTDKPA